MLLPECNNFTVARRYLMCPWGEKTESFGRTPDGYLVRVRHRGGGGADLVVAVEGGDFVALSEGGVVEDGVDEVVEGAAEGQDGLAYVNELCGLGADDVDAQQLPRVPVE